MDVVFLLLTVLGIIIAIIFGYLQVAVPFIKGEVRFSKRFPFVETAEAALAAKPRRRRKKKRKRFLIPILAIGILVILFVLIRFLVFQTKAIERVPIAVINFTNRTGDEQFDYLCEAIPNLLITNLEQSKHLSVLTWERMRDLLKVLGKEAVHTVDEDLGFEICEMDDIHAIVIGSFTKAGDVFVTEVKVLDVKTKKLLKSASSEGEGVASILKTQIDELTKDIARGVSRYERVIETTKFKIVEVTTTSMDAYNYFLRGREEYQKFHADEALRFLEKAIELDSTFAMAYRELANTYGQLREYNKRDKMFEKAMAYAHKVTEKERLYIEQAYADLIEENREKYARIVKEIVKKYPKEKQTHHALSDYYWAEGMFTQAIEELKKVIALDPHSIAWRELTYLHAKLGNFDKALECANQYALVSPGDADPFDTMGDIYVWMGKLDEALAKYKQAIEIEPNYFYSCKDIAYVYVLREDYPEAMQWVDQYIDRSPTIGRKAEGYWWQGFYYSLLGNFEASQSALDRAANMMKEVGNPHGPIYLTKGWVFLEEGHFDLCREYFKKFIDILKIKPSQSIHHCFCLGMVDLRQGHVQSAKSRLAAMKDLLQEIEPDEWLQFYYDLLHAEVLLAEDLVDRSIQLCKHELRPPEFDGTMFVWSAIHYNLYTAKDLLARAYVKKGDIDKAIVEYERLITFDPKSKDRRLIHPKYHYRLARLYQEKGLKEKAILEYEKFLDIWKNADADRPELIDAKKRLAKLKEIS